MKARCAISGGATAAIAYNARGYPPSDVPEDPARYSQDRARDDIRAVLDALKIDKAHVVGISMGGFAVLHFGLAYPGRALSLVVAGCGYGAEPGKRQQFHDETAKTIALIEGRGMGEASKTYAQGPSRVQFQNKDPRGWGEFAANLAQHSTQGSALTMRGVQAQRPSLWELVEPMRRLEVPTLVMTGDEDDPCLEPGILMKRTIPDRRPRGVSEHRARPQPGRARSIQPQPRRVLPPGRTRALAAPRPPRRDRLDPRRAVGLGPTDEMIRSAARCDSEAWCCCSRARAARTATAIETARLAASRPPGMRAPPAAYRVCWQPGAR